MNQWLEYFARSRNRLITHLEQLSEKLDSTEDIVACHVIALRALDRLVGLLLANLDDETVTYPKVPADGYTLVRRNRRRYFNQYRQDKDLIPPPPLEHGEFDEALDLQWTYVIPPLKAGKYFTWEIRKVPEVVEYVWQANPRLFVALISFPHGLEQVELDIDLATNTFRVLSLGPNEDRIIEELITKLESLIERCPSDIILPELTYLQKMAARLNQILKARPGAVGLVLAGSHHVRDSEGNWRNRSVAFGPYAGAVLPTVYHDKITLYPLPEAALRSRGYSDAADKAKAGKVEILEGITVLPRRVIIYDSGELGRIGLLICRDILEPKVIEFCAQHQLDHLFVHAMSPSLVDFDRKCAELGRRLDAGDYVANTCFGKAPRDPALIYLPTRGRQKKGLCERDGHNVCISSVDLREGEPQVSIALEITTATLRK